MGRFNESVAYRKYAFHIIFNRTDRWVCLITVRLQIDYMNLIPAESNLRRIPADVDRRTILFLDGIRYSIQSFEISSRRLAQTLNQLSNAQDTKDNLGEIISIATIDAWSIIDSIHRLRELLEQLPRLKKNTPELQLFLHRTSPIEDLRHFFQHFRTEIDSFVEKAMPLWGTISWSTTNSDTGLPQTHTIVPGTFFHGAWFGSCTFDTHEGRFIDRVVLHAGPQKVDLADLEDYVNEFMSWYLEWYELKFTGDERLGSDVHMKLNIKPALKETSENESNAT